MDQIVKYARCVLNSIEKRPKMHGNNISVEMQYLLTLEFLALALGHPHSMIKKSYQELLERVPGPSNLPLSHREMCIEDIVESMKTIRNFFDIDVEEV